MKLLQPKDTLWYKDAIIYEAHGDWNGVRTPMQWSNDRNAGFLTPILRSFIRRLLWVKYDFLVMDFERDSNTNQHQSAFESAPKGCCFDVAQEQEQTGVREG